MAQSFKQICIQYLYCVGSHEEGINFLACLSKMFPLHVSVMQRTDVVFTNEGFPHRSCLLGISFSYLFLTVICLHFLAKSGNSFQNTNLNTVISC